MRSSVSGLLYFAVFRVVITEVARALTPITIFKIIGSGAILKCIPAILIMQAESLMVLAFRLEAYSIKHHHGSNSNSDNCFHYLHFNLIIPLQTNTDLNREWLDRKEIITKACIMDENLSKTPIYPDSSL